MQLSFSPVGNYAIVACVVALLLVLLTTVGPRDRLTSGRRRVLAALRGLAILLLLAVMLRPTLVRTEVTRQSATLVVLADASRSMQVADMVGNQTRWQAMVAALDAVAPQLAELDDELDVELYRFDTELMAFDNNGTSLAIGGPPEGQQTAMGAALEEVLRRQTGKRLAGVVLLGDGAQRALSPWDIPPQVPARRMADLGYPLYGVPLGQSRSAGDTRDIAIEELIVPETVFVKNSLDVAGRARVDGFAGKQLAFQLLFEGPDGQMQPVAASEATVREDGWRVPLEFSYVPQQSGEHKITLRAVPQPGELVTTNNEMSTFVTVLKGGLNVLYLEGTPRVEQKFLRRALDASPDIEVDYLRIDAQDLATRPKDLLERFKPQAYDVYIFGDIDATAFSTAELTALATAIERGAGFVMLGGFHSFGAGGYGTSPLADVLPITIDRLERQRFGDAIRGDLHLPQGQPLAMRPTPQGVAQGLLLLAPRDKNAAVWRQLPPLEGGNRFRGLKPGAQILAESEGGDPLIVAKDFGAGRVLAFAGDSTWRWWMEGAQQAHKRFWRQMVLWLARKDITSDNNVWVKLDQRRFAPQARVEFTLGAQSNESEPLDDAQFNVTVHTPGGTQAAARTRREGARTVGLFLDTATPGDYRIEVEAIRGGESLGTASARFLVYAQDLELDNPAADRGALENLAAITRGKTLAPEQLGELLVELKAAARQQDIETEVKRSLWDNWPFFLVFVSVLCTEWYFRKRWGLV